MKSHDRDGNLTGTDCPDKYDLQITDPDGVKTGFVLHWADSGSRGWTVEHQPPSLPANNSTQFTSGEAYDVRDANDYWRIVYTDWVGGLGQRSRDEADALANRYYLGGSLDVSHPGQFSLGPGYQANTTVGATVGQKAIAALSRVFASFIPATADPRASIRYSTDNVTWTPVTFSGTDPTNSVSDFTTDGQYVYAAMLTDGVWYGTTGTWSQWSSQPMTKLCFTGGYLFGAVDDSTSSSKLYYFDSAKSPQQVINAGAALGISPAVTTVGLVPSGNRVHWVVTGGGRTDIYEAWLDVSSGTITPQFAHLTTLPLGFVATAVTSYLETTYVGGYFRSGASQQVTIYAIVGGTPTLLVAPEQLCGTGLSVYGMTAYGHHLYFLTPENIWRWDLAKGGYAHFLSGILASGDIVAYKGQIWGAMSSWGMTNSTDAYASSGVMICSISSGGMKTVPKYFAYLDVELSGSLTTGQSVELGTTIDGVHVDGPTYTSGQSFSLALDTVGLKVEPWVTLNGPGSSTPTVTNVAVRFTPMASSRGVYTFTVSLFERMQANTGQMNDVSPGLALQRLRSYMDKIVAVDFMGYYFKGRIESLQMQGARRSPRSAEPQQGVLQIQIREM